MKRKKLLSIIVALIAVALWTLGFLSRYHGRDPESSVVLPAQTDASGANAASSPAPISSGATAPGLQSDFATAPGLQSDSATAPGLQSDSAPAASPGLSAEQSQAPNDLSPAPGDVSAPDDVPASDGAIPEAAPRPQARDLTGFLTAGLSDGTSASALLDRDYVTKRAINAGTSLEISAPEDIYSLYFIWDLPPGEWRLSSSGIQSCGSNGFIHEYIELSSPAREITALLPPNGSTLCDVYAFSDGAAPEWVQTWRPPWDEADLLALPTHADDEHLYFVGVLPYYAGELGYKVQVAYLTNHWNEPPRPHELLNGLWTVGIRNYPVISNFNDRYADTLQEAQAIYGLDNIVDYQVELLRRFKPLVVVGHDPGGEYGHGVHMLNAYALRIAVVNAADSAYAPASYEQYGAWDVPKLYLHLLSENAITMDWDVPLDNFDGATARDLAVAGYACHLSQQHWAFAVPRNGPTGQKFGLARSLVGPDIIGGDMFENIETRY